MKFRYQVLDKSKKTVTGSLEADSTDAARLSLLDQGYQVLALESADKRKIHIPLSGLGRVPLKEKMLFIKHLSLMLRAGMLLDESLAALYEQSRGHLKKILHNILEMVHKGNRLSDALQIYPYTFNEFFINMVRIGEQSGTLEQNLNQLSIKLKKDNELVSKVRSAMFYPMLVVGSIIGLGVIISVFVLPKLLVFFTSLHVQIPITTQIFIFTASFFVKYWYAAVLVVIIVSVALVVLNKMPRFSTPIHWIVLHGPILHQFSKNTNLANFCRSMGLMLNGGLTIDESLGIMARATNNNLYKNVINKVLANVQRGDSLAQDMAKYPHYFPTIVVKMIHVGEISGKLTETFDYMAEFYEDEVDQLSKNLATILEPALLIIIGIIVGFVALAILSPIYQLTAGISK